MIEFIGTSIAVTIYYNITAQWLCETRSIPYWTTSAFPSALTDLVLIYESVTSTPVFFLMLVGWDWVPCTAATSGLLYQRQMIGEGHCGAIGGPIVACPGDYDNGEFGGMKIGRGNRSTRRTRPSTTLSTTNPTWPDLGSNPGRCGGKPATNHLSYGAANILTYT
jgi:hypothetical protein